MARAPGSPGRGTRDRLHAAEGIVPTPIWVVLFFTASILLVFMLFFADSGERALVQGFIMGAVTAVIVATLLTLGVLNRPYSPDFGGLQPTAMQRTLGTLDNAREALNLSFRSRATAPASHRDAVAPPCVDRADDPPTTERSGRWIDTAGAVLLALALAAVATAWSSYQASRWTGEQAKTFSAANAARIESTKDADLANSQTQVDIALLHRVRRPHTIIPSGRERLRSTASRGWNVVGSVRWLFGRWWEEEDSNLRRLRRRFYRPLPLATRASSRDADKDSEPRRSGTRSRATVSCTRMAKDQFSFDIVSEVDLQEVRNAVDQTRRELSSGSTSRTPGPVRRWTTTPSSSVPPPRTG